MRNSIVFYINGEKKEVKGQDVFLPLSTFLRYEAHLTGTKVVCAEGDCGACTVMVAKWSPDSNAKTNSYHSINSCIAMTFAMDGASLVTIEGLSEQSEPCELQCSMIRNFGSQCGFCTPGFIMSMANMYEHKSKPTEQNAKNYLTGNLCRCTGYTPILQAALDVDTQKHVLLKNKFSNINFSELSNQMAESVLITTDHFEYFAPISLQEACRYKEEHPDAIIFSGGTDLGVQINKGHLQLKRILSLHLIKELYIQKIETSENDSEVIVGSRVILSEFQRLIEKHIPSMDNLLNIFASPQIKNMGTLVGNLANASPIADMTPVLMVLDAEVDISGQNRKRTKALKDFYLGYKKLDMQKDEIITQIRFKIPKAQQIIENYKVSQRRDLDISTVNASFNFTMNGNKIETARIAFGGVAATTVRLSAVEKQIEGKELNQHSIEEIKKLIRGSIKPLSDMRGTAEYRTLLAANLFEKYAKERLQI